jgi:hypothetical protein
MGTTKLIIEKIRVYSSKYYIQGFYYTFLAITSHPNKKYK